MVVVESESIPKPNLFEEAILAGADLSVIVPCYNEESTVETLLRRVRSSLPHAEIIFVDDGSTDSGLSIAKNVADELDIVIKHQSNLGKGAAFRAGLEIASRDWIVVQDADLEYDPNDIRLLIKAAQKGEMAAVYGSRYKASGRVKGGAWLNYIGVKILAILQLLLYGKWLSDPHTCYKMVRASILRAMNIQSSGFELCAEMNSKLLRSGVKIKEISIRYIPRTVAEGKKIRWRDFVSTIVTYLRFCFR